MAIKTIRLITGTASIFKLKIYPTLIVNGLDHYTNHFITKSGSCSHCSYTGGSLPLGYFFFLTDAFAFLLKSSARAIQ